MKQNLHAMADTIVNISIDFFVVWTGLHAELYMQKIINCIWILHTESGIDYIVREL